MKNEINIIKIASLWNFCVCRYCCNPK